MLDMRQLHLFLRIVDLGSLAAAGRDLALSPATVTERLAALETALGVRLLARSTRSLSLTPEGRVLAEGARALLGQAETLEAALRDGADQVAGLVTVTAPVDLGRQRVVPAIERAMAAHPRLKIDLRLTDRVVGIVSEGVDVAVRYGALPDSGLMQRKLADSRRAVCAAPAYLAARGAPDHPADLARHDCLLMRSGPRLVREWPFVQDGRPLTVTVTCKRIADDGALVREWCLAGHGLAMKSLLDVADDLAAGRLVEVLAPFAAPSAPLHLLFPAGPLPPRTRAVIEAIAAAF